MAKDKVISAGVILTDGKRLLAIKPWGHQKNLDLPKGRVDPGEEWSVAAARELKEETGVTVQERTLKSLGRFSYTEGKDLVLFVYRGKVLPSIRMMRCTSFFMNPWGKEVPEAVGYEYVGFEDPRFYKSLQPVLKKVKATLLR